MLDTFQGVDLERIEFVYTHTPAEWNAPIDKPAMPARQSQ